MVGQRAFDALISLEGGKVFATCTTFPLRRGLRSDVVDTGHEVESLYDPAFVLPLFAAALSSTLTGLDWVELLRSNVLGLAVCSLASRDVDMRNLGGYVLSKAMKLISVSAPAPIPTIRLIVYRRSRPSKNGLSYFIPFEYSATRL